MGVLLGLVVVLASLPGAALFRLRGAKEARQWTGRGVGTWRWLWAAYTALAAFAVDRGTAAAWGYPVASCWGGRWPFLGGGWGRGGDTLVPAMCHGVDGGGGLGGALLVVPVPGLLVLLVVALWAGCTAGWWGSLGVKTPWQVVKHSARGVLFALPAAIVIWSAGLGQPWLLLTAGLMCGPIYRLTLHLNPGRAVENGEWLFGGALVFGLLFGVAFG